MQGLDAKKYKSSLDCARTILRNHGPMFFYKGEISRKFRRKFREFSLKTSGAVPRLIRVCGDAAIAFSVYGQIVKYLNKI
jgi:solute carrier family 25 (mitochondrial citrate transporter), member 1